MNNLKYIVVFLLFEFNITFQIGNTTPSAHALYLLPRFLGYFLLFLFCSRTPTFFKWTSQCRWFFFAMLLFELQRWFTALLFYQRMASFAKVEEAVSVVAGMCTVKLITQGIARLETNYSVDLCAHKLNASWRWLVLFFLFSLVPVFSSAVWWIAALIRFFICIYYCVQLRNSIRTFWNIVPRRGSARQDP